MNKYVVEVEFKKVFEAENIEEAEEKFWEYLEEKYGEAATFIESKTTIERRE